MAPKMGASSEVGAVSRLFLHPHSVSGPGKRNTAAGERVATILTLAKGTPAQALLQTCPFTGRDPGMAPWVSASRTFPSGPQSGRSAAAGLSPGASVGGLHSWLLKAFISADWAVITRPLSDTIPSADRHLRWS